MVEINCVPTTAFLQRLVSAQEKSHKFRSNRCGIYPAATDTFNRIHTGSEECPCPRASVTALNARTARRANRRHRKTRQRHQRCYVLRLVQQLQCRFTTESQFSLTHPLALDAGLRQPDAVRAKLACQHAQTSQLMTSVLGYGFHGQGPSQSLRRSLATLPYPTGAPKCM